MRKNRAGFINIPGDRTRHGDVCRANAVEVAALRALADYEAVNKSEAARIAIREAAKARGLWDTVIAEMQEAVHVE